MSKQKSWLPKHIISMYGTARNFKATKRLQIKRLEKVFTDLRLGCAFLPNGEGEIGRIQDGIDALKRKASVKEWGR